MTTISASRRPLLGTLLALIVGGLLVALYPAFQFAWWAVRGERIDPAIAASLEVIRARATIGATSSTIETTVGEQGWRATRHDRALTEKLLAAQWMHFGPKKPRPAFVPYEASIEVTPAGDAVYRSLFPCGYRLRVFFLLDASDRIVQVIEAQHPVCL